MNTTTEERAELRAWCVDWEYDCPSAEVVLRLLDDIEALLNQKLFDSERALNDEGYNTKAIPGLAIKWPDLSPDWRPKESEIDK